MSKFIDYTSYIKRNSNNDKSCQNASDVAHELRDRNTRYSEAMKSGTPANMIQHFDLLKTPNMEPVEKRSFNITISGQILDILKFIITDKGETFNHVALSKAIDGLLTYSIRQTGYARRYVEHLTQESKNKK